MSVLEQVKEYAKTTLKTGASVYDESGRFPEVFINELCQKFNILSLIAKENNGQMSREFLESIRTLATQFPSLAIILLTQGYYGIFPIHHYGTTQQKERYLQKLILGEWIAGLGYSEENYYITKDLLTTATQTDNGWILNGEKTRISNSLQANILLILAKTILKDGTTGRGFFIVETSLAGVHVSQESEKVGLNSLSVSPVVFRDVVLDNDALLGGIANGNEQLNFLVNRLQLGLSAIAIGIALGAFKRGLNFVKVPRGFGKRLIDVEYHQFMFADLYNKLCAAEAYFASFSKEDEQDPLFISRIKLFATEVAMDITQEVQRIIGPLEKVEAMQLQRLVNDACLIENYGKSGNSIRRTIAKGWVEE